mgnify:CR=1 FL=1|tara:strand:- start:948 stop:2021 length:1074 start_codon:yes stop_codon:yes gene_type:complete
MQKNKIVIIMPSLKAGGAQRVIINIIKSLTKKKYKVLLVLICYKGDLYNTLPKDIKVEVLNKKRVRYGLFDIFKILKKNKPDIVFSSLAHVNLILLFLKKFLSKKIKFIIREANTPSVILKSSRIKFLYNILYRSADKIIAQSNLIRSELITSFNINDDLIVRINNPIDVKLVRENIKSFKRFDEKKKILISAGRLVYQKGFDTLIRILSKYNEDFYLIILGEGPEHAYLKEISRKFKIEEKIIFYGYIEKPWEMIASADIFLLPSRWEGMPNAALEALACGTKVIASHQSGGLIDLKDSIKNKDIILTNFDNNFIRELEENTKILKRNVLPSKLPSEFFLENTTSAYINLFREIVK